MKKPTLSPEKWEDKFDRRFAGYSFLKEDGHIEFDGLRKETVRHFIQDLIAKVEQRARDEERDRISRLLEQALSGEKLSGMTLFKLKQLTTPTTNEREE